MKKIFIIILIILTGSYNIINANDRNDLLQREKELKEIGLHIKEAVLQHDVAKILRYVAHDGIPCNDGMIPYSKILKDLKDHNSWLYSYLFSSETFEKKYKNGLYPMGLERFFREAPNAQIRVSFMENKGEKIIDYGCIYYEATNIEYTPEFCFFFKNGKWTFTDSLYNCT